MPTLVTVFPAVLKSQKRKKTIISINFIEFTRGGSGPKHSAFCGGCFSINTYRGQSDQKWSDSDTINHVPSVFFMAHVGDFLTIFYSNFVL
jgi:hypothetical protein